MRTWSLALRLTVWYALMAFILVAAGSWAQYRALAADLASEDDQLLLETLAVVQRGVPITQPTHEAGAMLGPVVRVLDADCIPVAGTARTAAPPPECQATSFPTAGPGGAPELRTWQGPDDALWRVARQPIASAAAAAMDARGGRWIEVALDRGTDVAVLRRYRGGMAVLLGVTLLLAAALGHAIARRSLRPLDSLAGIVARVDVRSLDEPIRFAKVPAEVRALAGSFDFMRRRLNAAFGALTHFSTELAHDLRTPLHVLRQQTEVVLGRERTPEEYREVLESQLEELDRLRRMVDDTLFLARSEDPRARIECRSLDAREELGAVAEFLEALAVEQGISVAVDTPAGLRVCADRMLLRRAVVNLITNAVRHAPPRSTVTLAARIDAKVPCGVMITVHDTGAGVPPELVPHVFERYVRTTRSSARPDAGEGSADGSAGTGLGLAIVRGIMSLHGGTVAMESGRGHGTTVTLCFPERPTVS